MIKQIIAMGGGGFSMEPDNLLLDKYILEQSNKVKPKICFVPTASGDSNEYIQNFYKSFSLLECETSHLSLFKPPSKNLEEYIMTKDIIFVGGGNTNNLLILWKAWKLDDYFRKAYNSGIILSGLSAGSICWFEEGVTDSFHGELTKLNCLGFLKGSYCPHYDGEEERRPSYHKLIELKEIKEGYGVDDGVGLHYVNDTLYKVVSSRPNAKGYRVSVEDNVVIEEQLDTYYLGINS